MNHSDYYSLIAHRIHRNEVEISDLKHLLSVLEDEGVLSARENRTLLDLANGIETGNTMPENSTE